MEAGETDAQGEFRLSLERPSIERYYNMRLIVAATKHAPRWYQLPTDAAPLICELQTGQVVRGRLVDSHGRPAAGVEVHVLGVATRGTIPANCNSTTCLTG